MRNVVRWVFATVVILHGLIHLPGAVKGFGWAPVEQLSSTPSVPVAVAWLAAASLLVGTGVTLLAGYRWWWVVGAVALILSQALIFSGWTDAKAGLAPNVLLLIGVVYGFAAEGPSSYRARYRRLLGAALPTTPADRLVTDADLAALPEQVATYVRLSGAVGQPRVGNFRARISGRIRGGPDKPWMAFTGEQINTYGSSPSRVLLMDATMFGLPVDVLHAFVGAHATMQVKLCSLLKMVDAAGPDMDRAETVTMFNDLCVLAPAALVDAPVQWEPIDERRVRGEFTRGPHTVAAVLTFDAEGSLVDFVSDDRLRSAPDGKSFRRQRWSTPLAGYRAFGPRRISARGEARWHAPQPEGEFTYLEFRVDAIAYNAAPEAPLEAAAMTEEAAARSG